MHPVPTTHNDWKSNFESPYNVPKTSPKDPIWPSRGLSDLTAWGRLNLKGSSWEGDLGRCQDVLRTSPRGPSKHVFGTVCGHLLNVPKFLFTFLSELIRLTKSIWKQFNTQSVFITQSNFYAGAFFAKVVNGFYALTIFVKWRQRKNLTEF